jgi:uncharacterized damage-inducible protein DinB
VSSYVDELYAHQEWADAEHWRAFEAYPPALADRALFQRLHHIHMVQQAFLWSVGPRTSEFKIGNAEDFANSDGLKTWARQYHGEVADFLKNLPESRLEEMIEIFWFKPPLRISVRHALTQAAMHSHYHRGQNATRLRELGGVPPGTDFIVWLRNGQPAPRWT